MSDELDTTLVLEGWMPRGTNAIECEECGGFCARVDATKEETARLGCGRPWACCNAAFVCKKCGQRYATALEAPEMD